MIYIFIVGVHKINLYIRIVGSRIHIDYIDTHTNKQTLLYWINTDIHTRSMHTYNYATQHCRKQNTH